MTTQTTINYEAVKEALASIDARFVVFDDFTVNDRANYCSIRLVLSDKTIDTRKVFCIYYNAKSVTLHCAKRFACDESFRLNKKQTEYTKSVALDALKSEVDALLTKECERLKMSAYEAKKATASKRKVKKAQ